MFDESLVEQSEEQPLKQRYTRNEQQTLTDILNKIKYKIKLDGLWRPSVDVDGIVTSTVCCDVDLWPAESNQVINRGQCLFPL